MKIPSACLRLLIAVEVIRHRQGGKLPSDGLGLGDSSAEEEEAGLVTVIRYNGE